MDPFAPATLGPVTLRNRTIKAATFEGMTPDGVVTDDLIAFHRRVAAGGVGMTTLAFCAVSPDGRAAPGELVLNEEALPGLRRLTDEVHGLGAAACAQVGHAGPVAGAGQRGVAPSRVFSPIAMRFTRAATDADLARITDDFARGADLLARAGFDAVEVHLGHGYLLSAFLSPRLNRRRDAWGGDIEGRSRFPRQVVRAVRAAAGPGVAVTAKLNMRDGVRGGLEIEDSIAVARLLQDDGALDALQLTGGSSFQNPMYLFRGDAPVAEMAAALPGIAGVGVRLFGRRFLRTYPFEEAFFAADARRFLAALDLPVILLGGINRLDTIERAMDDGFAFVAMARALLHDPALVSKMAAGTAATGGCTHCNACMPSIYTGTRCVLPEPEAQPARFSKGT